MLKDRNWSLDTFSMVVIYFRDSMNIRPPPSIWYNVNDLYFFHGLWDLAGVSRELETYFRLGREGGGAKLID